VLYAYDAVAIVVNPANPDTAMSVSTLAQILSGKQAKWTSGPMAGQEIVPVFDDPNSSNVNFLRQRLNLKELSPKTTSSGRHAAVIDYVSHTPGAIGVIGVWFISDVDNARSRQFRQDVRIVALSEKEPATEANAYQPYQAYLSQNKYPLRREVYLLSGEYHTGLGTGFISWATSDKGQRIILKSGLLPASMPVRVVDFKKKAAEENTEAE
jgi:phosphate transport system substrate-binding protein